MFQVTEPRLSVVSVGPDSRRGARPPSSWGVQGCASKTSGPSLPGPTGLGPHREAGALQESEGPWVWGGPYIPEWATRRGGQTRRRRPRDRGGRGGSGRSTRQGTPGGQGPAGTEAEAWGGSFLRAPGVGARAPSGLWGRAPSASGGFGPRFVLICCDGQVPGLRSPPLRLRHFGERGCLAHGGDSGLALCTSPWTLRSAQARAGVLPQAPRP